MIAMAAVALAFTLSCAGTFLTLKLALRSGLLDIPNFRSAHQVATARGGGLAIVASTFVVLAVLTAARQLDSAVLLAVGIGGSAVAMIGYLDDRHQVAPSVRLIVHVMAAVWALWCLGGLPPLRLGQTTYELGWAGDLLGIVGIVWALNLFNFMDGIDGIAAAEAGFVCLAAALLIAWSGSSFSGIALAAAACGAASLGFLVWNRPAAKIFMGDVGSGYLGYTIAILAVTASREDPTALVIWVVLGGLFVVDATVTLLFRLGRGESLHQAHRTHAYQLLARRWGSHRRVVLTATAVNVLWLLPCSILATLQPDAAGWILGAALAPLIVAATAIGAGRLAASNGH
jgi:Fuc2NAc and GlcNAc transferase